MEPEEGELQGLNIGSSNLLALPEPYQWDSDEELLGVGGGIKPKSSPIPRRRSSLSCSDDESQPPPSSSRRVSFADAFGLSLVSVKKFDTRSLCDSTDPLEIDLKNAKEYFLELLFALPLTLEELLCRVREQKVDLESLELLPETTTIKGTVRVLNLCFHKLVYIRTSLDCWSSHFDLLAEYVPESSHGSTDCFSFKVTLVPPFGQPGARVDFCIRYETAFGTFWANNSGQNFILFCHEKVKEQDDNEKPKSCLKPARHSFTTSTTSNSLEIPGIILDCGITAITEPVATKEKKTQEGQRNLKEESIRICSRRSKRKAARMAKLQQYFAQKEEKDLQQTEKDTDDINISVPAIDEAPLHLSTQQTNNISILAEPEKKHRQESVVALDVERNQVSSLQTENRKSGSIPVIQPELITSKSQTIRPALDSAYSHKSGLDSRLLNISQDKDTDTSQAVVLRYPMTDKSIGKTVEKAWECFEKCAKEKMPSTTDINCSPDHANHVEHTLSENHPASQPPAHHYTFETIVAPLYHQVFERMENDRRKVNNCTSESSESAGKPDHGRLSVVTYTNVDTRSYPEISAKHGNDDDDWHETSEETFQQYLHPTKSSTDNSSSVTKVQREREEDVDFLYNASSDVTNYFLDTNISESNAASVVMDSEKQDTLDQQLSFLEEVSTNVQSEQDFPAIVFEDKSVIQKSLKSQMNTEINKTQDKEAQTSEQILNICIKHLGKSNSLLPDSTLFSLDILANVTPKINQSEGLSPSQDLSQATIQHLIPDSGVTVPHVTSVIQETVNTCQQNGESSHRVGSEDLESISNDKNEDGDIWKNIKKDNETILKKTLKMSPEEADGDVCQITDKKEHQTFLSNLPHIVTEDSNAGSNPDHPEDASRENVKKDEENTHVKISKNEDQELTSCLRENPSDDDIKEVQKQLEETEKEKQENDEQFKERSCGRADNDEKPKDNSDERDAAPQTNAVDWKDIEDLHDQVTVDVFGPGATLRSISNEDSLINEVPQRIEEELPNTKQSSKEPGSKGQTVSEVKVIVCETGSSQEDNPEDASQENVEEEIDVKENIQIKDPGRNVEQELASCLHEKQSEEVEKQLEEKEQEKQVGQINNEKAGPYVPADNVEKPKKDAEEQDAVPQRNVEDLKDKKDLEDDLHKQVTVHGFGSVAILQSISNKESFIKEIDRPIGEQQSNICLEQLSEESENKGQTVSGAEESFEALDVNIDVAFRDCAKDVQSNSKEKTMCYQVDNDANDELEAFPGKPESDCLNRKSENMDDSTSTESLTDDEMEVYLLRLKSTQQTELKNVLSMQKRHSISRSWTMSSPMPSISEHTDEDQATNLLEDLIPKQTPKLEKDALALSDEEEEDIETNLLWWREFFSSENMAKVMAYTLLLVVFLITSYICDFMACFGLYLIALYWLYFQVQREPLKLKRHLT